MACEYIYKGAIYTEQNIQSLLTKGEFETALANNELVKTEYSKVVTPSTKLRAGDVKVTNEIALEMLLKVVDPNKNASPTVLLESIKNIDAATLNIEMRESMSKIADIVSKLSPGEQQRILTTFLQNKDLVFENMLNELKRFGINIDSEGTNSIIGSVSDSVIDDDGEVIDEATQLYTKQANTINPLENVQGSIKLLLTTLTNGQKNKAGLTQRVSPMDAHRKLVEVLANKDLVEMKETLESLGNSGTVWAKQIVSKVFNKAEGVTAEQYESTKLEFWRSYANMKLRTNSLTYDIGKGMILTEDKTRSSENLRFKTQWRANAKILALENQNKYKNIPTVNPWSISPTTNGPILDKLIVNAMKSHLLGPKSTIEDHLKFLELLGINFDRQPVVNLTELRTNTNYLVKSILDSKKPISNIYDVSDSGSDKLYFLGLANASANTPTNLQFINAEGKTVYSVSLPNEMSRIIDEFGRVEVGDNIASIMDRLPHLNNSFSRYSKLLDVVTNYQGVVTPDGATKLKNISIDMLSGIAVANSGSSGVSTNKVSDADRVVMSINTVMNTQNSRNMSFQHADKSTTYQYNLLNNLAKMSDQRGESTVIEGELKSALEGYLKSELLTVAESIYNQINHPDLVEHFGKATNTRLREGKGDFQDAFGNEYKFGNMAELGMFKDIIDGNVVRKYVIDNALDMEFSDLVKGLNSLFINEDIPFSIPDAVNPDGTKRERTLAENLKIKADRAIADAKAPKSPWIESFVTYMDTTRVPDVLQLWEDSKIIPSLIPGNLGNSPASSIRILDGEYGFHGISSDILSVSADSFTDALPKLTEGLTALARAYELNNMVGLNEQARLIYGDPRWTKGAVDFIKRSPYVSSSKSNANNSDTVNASLIDQASSDNIKLVGNRMDNKYNHPEFQPGGEFYGKIKSVIGEEQDNFISDSVGEMMEAATNDSLRESIRDSYSKINESDGHGLVSLDEYRDILHRAGKLTPELNKTYGLLRNQAEKVFRGEPLTDKDMITDASALEAFVQLKTQVAGVNDKGRPIFYKHSLSTFIPQLMEGTRLANMFKDMNADRIGIFQYASATKIAPPTNEYGEGLKYHDENGNFGLFGNLSEYTEGVPYEFMGIQVAMGTKAKDKVTMGTQDMKLVWTNMLGVNDKLDGLYNEAVGLYENMHSEGLAEVIDELGLIKDPQGNYSIIPGGGKLVDVLLKEAISKDADANVINGIESMRNNPVIDDIATKDNILSIISSMLEKRMMKHKFNGEAYTQMPVTGLETSPRTSVTVKENGKDVLKVRNSNKLGFYKKGVDGRTLPMQVGIPLPKDLSTLLNDEWFFKSDIFNSLSPEVQAESRSKPTAIARLNVVVAEVNDMFRSSSLEKFNENEVISNFYNDVLSSIAFRIPTQSHNSIENINVGFFTSPMVATSIITPTEMTAKSGSDYDIDKLFTYRKKNLFTGSSIGLDDAHRSANRLIEIKQEVLASEELYLDLITPNSVELFNPYIIKESSISMSELYGSVAQLKAAESYYSGAATIGVQANSSTSHSLAQASGLKFNSQVLTDEKSEGLIAEGYDLIDLNEGSIAEELTVIRDANGLVKLDNKYSADGLLISAIMSQVMDGAVDIAKDAWITRLGITDNTAGVLNIALRMGVPLNQILPILASPIVKEYQAIKKFNSSMLVSANENLLKSKKYDIIVNVREKYKFNDESFKLEQLGDGQYKNGDDIYSLEDVIFSRNEKGESSLIPFEEMSLAGQGLQATILDVYLELEYLANNMQLLQGTANADTKANGGGITSITDRLLNRVQLNSKKYTFEQRGHDKYIDEGIHGAFNKGMIESNAILSLYTTIRNNPLLNEQVNAMYEYTVDGATYDGNTRDKIFKRIESDLLQYVIQRNFSDDVFNDFTGSKSLPVSLMELKNNPELASNGLFKELEMSIVTNEDSDSFIDNLTLFNRKMTSQEANAIIEGFEELSLLKTASNPDFGKNLAKRIARFAIVQSGNSVSNLSFTNLIPNSLYKEVIGDLNFDDINFSDFATMFYWNNEDLLMRYHPQLRKKFKRKTWKDYQLKMYKEGPFENISGGKLSKINIFFSSSTNNIEGDLDADLPSPTTISNSDNRKLSEC